ncbi:MAG: metal-dependent hydrolase [Acidobacteria bacterium]|nr:metal-dependent hydrolase [Acidobacteriota bacterium]MCW5968640.1 metal-dependent hydrolase [Blastocatellales bacterium]
MMAKTHALFGVAAGSLLVGTADPFCLGVAAVASQLPDADTSKSIIGRILFPISRLLEKRFPHRTLTHSFLATMLIAAIAWPLRWHSPQLWKAALWGYFFGWFADAFTRAGVAAFYPLTSARLVIPANPRLRMQTGSKAEYIVILLLIGVLAASLHLNTKGGLMRTLTMALGRSESLVKLYQAEGARRRVIADIQGRFAASNVPLHGSYDVIEASGENLIVRAVGEKDGVLYLAGHAQECASCQILIERVKGALGAAVTTVTRELRFEDRKIGDVLDSLRADGAEIRISGEIILDDADLLSWPISLQRFNPVTVSGASTKTLKLQAATPADLERAADYFGRGQLLVREVRDVR